MALTFPNVKYRSGNHTVATAVSLPVFSAPFAGVNVDYILKQEFMQLLTSFVPLALNTPHPDYPAFLLVEEGDKSDEKGGNVRWTRTYAKVPDSYNEPGGNIGYNFIGFEGDWGVGVTTNTGRQRFTRNVEVKIQKDFFLVAVGQTYTTWQAIPRSPEQHYYDGSDTTIEVDYLRNHPPFTAATVPSLTAYKAMITADAAGIDSFSIVAEESVVSRWQGNIFLRETRRIKAL